MKEPSSIIIHTVRSLMPARTLSILGRSLTQAEARIVTERQVTKLLDLLDITKPSVEIELIAELPTIEIEVVPNLPLSGTSDWQLDHWHVRINADDSLWRCRSTLAHELKHILDDPFREELYPDWPRESTSPPPHRAEEICDYFAGCVLAPTPWLKDAWMRGLRDTAELASLFDVSEALIRVRLYQIGLRSHHTQNYSRRAYTRNAAELLRAARKRLADERIKDSIVGAQLCA